MKDTTNENHLDFIGDNLAINFINTRRMIEGELTDKQSGSDVKGWLKRLEVAVAKGALSFSDGVLLQGARELREIALAGVKDRKSGEETLVGHAQQIPEEYYESYGACDRRCKEYLCDSCLWQRDG